MIILLRSDFYGQGKSVTAVSFKRPDVEPKRLVYDWELRADTYKSPGNTDDRSKLQFAFDFWNTDVNIVDSVVEMCNQLKAGAFGYNVMVFDNATMFQDELVQATQTEADARKLANATGAGATLNGPRRFNPNDTASYYYFIKAAIRGMLRMLKMANVDVIVTSESRNKWQDYGKREMKILGQTAKLLDPWLQMADALFVLNRIEGDRDSGKAKMLPYPIASLDTFNIKCSLPGVQPVFKFDSWDIFWKMISNRRVPTAKDFAALDIPASVIPDVKGELSESEIKQIVIDYALEMGVIRDKSANEAKRLLSIGLKHNLDISSILIQYEDWLTMIAQEALDAT